MADATNITRRALVSALPAAAVVMPAVAVALPAAPDPLLELVTAYRYQLAVYNAPCPLEDEPQTNEEADAFAEATFRPYERALSEPPKPTSIRGCVAALDTLLDRSADDLHCPDMAVPILTVVANYLRQRMDEGARS